MRAGVARGINGGMTNDSTIDADLAWAAFERRDRAFDGRFLVGVRTTGIYCRPSCAARRPRRENVTFYTDADEARAAGLRACRRCLPDDEARDRIAVARAVALIEQADEPPSLTEIAAAARWCSTARTVALAASSTCTQEE